MRLIVASHNQHKVLEIKHLLSACEIELEVKSLKDMNFNQEIIEDGHSFMENSLIKAKTVQQAFVNDLILADDSGFCVKALNHQPGIYSARFLGENASYQERMDYILKQVSHQSRDCYFSCAMVLLGQNINFVTQKNCYGTLALKPQGEEGFGYDPLFIPSGYHVTFAQDSRLKDKLSHRSLALNEIIQNVKYLL